MAFRVLLSFAVALAFAGTARADRKTSEPSVDSLAVLELDPESPQIDCGADLRPIVAWLAEHPDGVVFVTGHADATGPADFRRAFARAAAVREQLIELAVDPDHIIVAAFAIPDGKVIVWGATAPPGSVATR